MKPAWFGFGIDPISEKLVAITVTETKEAAEKNCLDRLKIPEAQDICVWRVFNLMAMEGVREFRDWLICCKVPRAQIPKLMEEMMASLRKK